MNDAVLAFDFDGVMVDSTWECFVVAVAAFDLFVNQPSSTPHLTAGFIDSALQLSKKDSRWPGFFEGRKYVRFPWEYLPLMRRIESKEGTIDQRFFDTDAVLDRQEQTRFQTLFLAVRKQLKTTRPDEWLRLFISHDDVIAGVKEVFTNGAAVVVTGRDGDSVLTLLRAHGVPIEKGQIYDVERFENKLHAFEAVKADLGAGRSYAIIDDNVKHLELLKQVGVKPYWATWGYVCSDHHAIGDQIAAIRCDRSNWLEIIKREFFGYAGTT